MAVFAMSRGRVSPTVGVDALVASRRAVLIGAACGFVVAGMSGGLSPVARASTLSSPILSFHRDEPWLDQSGGALPWIPSRGCRGGATLGGVTDESLRRLNCYL